MTRLIWDAVGGRRFEAGVDRGVLYTTDGSGIAWSGLTSVRQNPSGGDATPYFIDGEQYVNVPARETLEGSIEALTYPDEFELHDGTYSYASGLSVDQQRRLPFSLSYRTKVGDDLLGIDRGYRLHIIYNMLAKPASREYKTLNDSVDPLSFSWDFTTTLKRPKSTALLAPLAHVVIDSKKTSPPLLSYIEQLLYGTSKVAASLIPLDTLVSLFEHPQSLLGISSDTTTGLNTLVTNPARGDLIGPLAEGIYSAPDGSRLIATAIPGLYTLES